MKLARHRIEDNVLRGLALLAVALPLLLLAVLVGRVAWMGLERLDVQFLTSMPSSVAARAGIFPAMVGSIWLISLTALISLPIGVASALYLEEYAKNTRFARIVETNIATLAGVPSVVYGLLGLEFFVRTLGMGKSLIAGACTLTLLILPVVIISSREAIRTVPATLKEAAWGLGSTRLQMIRRVMLPMALPGILTGSILAISRAIGETAPIVVVGALAYISFAPTSPGSPYTALPVQIYNWSSDPRPEFITNAAAGIVVLLVTVLLLNATAIFLRDRMQRTRL